MVENVWSLTNSRVPWLVMFYLLTTDEVVCREWGWLERNTKIIYQSRGD